MSDFQIRLHDKGKKPRVEVRHPRTSEVPTIDLAPPPGVTTSTATTPASRSVDEEAERFKWGYVFLYRLAQGDYCGSDEYVPSSKYDSDGTWIGAVEVLRAKGIDPTDYLRTLFRGLRSNSVFPSSLIRAIKGEQGECRQKIVHERTIPKPSGKVIKALYGEIRDLGNMTPPSPAQITQDRYIEMYHRYADRAVQDADFIRIYDYGRIKGQANYLLLYGTPDSNVSEETRIDNARISALTDSFLSASPLLCYALACEFLRLPESSPEDKARNDRFRVVMDRFLQPAINEFLHNSSGFLKGWADRLPSFRTIVEDAETYYNYMLSRMKESITGNTCTDDTHD